MGEINQELEITPEKEKDQPEIHIEFSTHDNHDEVKEELEEITYHSVKNFTLSDNHFWNEPAAEFVKNEKPGMLVLNTLPPGSDIQTISYMLPDAPGSIREVYNDTDPLISATGLSFHGIPDGPVKTTLIKLREENAYNWDDPQNEELKTKIKGIFLDKGPQAALRTAVRLAIITYAPFLLPANELARGPLKGYIQNRSLPLNKATEMLTDKSPIQVSPEVISLVHRWSHFPFVGTRDLDFQRAVMALKTADIYEKVGSENIPGDIYALLPSYEKRARYLVNNRAEQEEVAHEEIADFFAIFNELAHASNTLITPELRTDLVNLVTRYLASVEVRKIEPMREPETVHLTEKHMPIVYAGVSPTLEKMVKSIADAKWSIDDICYFPEEPGVASSLRRRLGFR